MKIYTVHRLRAGSEAPVAAHELPLRRRASRRVRELIRGEPEAIVLVKEGLCWPAAAFTIGWAVWHRLWMFAACVLAVGAALGTVIAALEPDPVRDATLVVCGLILIGCFANDARRRALAARGYEFAGIVLGRSADGAQLRYLSEGGAVMEEARA